MATTSRRFDRRAEEQLVIHYHCHSDLKAREELTRRLMPLARELARRYANHSEPA